MVELGWCTMWVTTEIVVCASEEITFGEIVISGT